MMFLRNTTCQRFDLCRRWLHASIVSSNSQQQVRIKLFPSPSCFFDEAVQVKVEGLSPHQTVQVKSKLTDDRGVVFASSACYAADASGQVDLSSAASLGGSYTGIEPMGLFWSMKPETPHSRLLKKTVLTPTTVDLDVCGDGGEVLASESNVRKFMKPGMKRIVLEEERIRGVLFMPPGKGPFPGIIDLHTFGGGISEARASLLANKGFAVLALAYYRYEDLPQRAPEQFELEYFEEAMEFMNRQPQVKSSGLGVMSISKSSDFSLSMASLLRGVSATVSVNGCNCVNVVPLSYRGTVAHPVEPVLENFRITAEGLLDIRDVLPDPRLDTANHGSLIPLERSEGRFLFAASEADRNWNSVMFMELAAERLREHGKGDRCEVVTYGEVGHLLEVPYTPFCGSAVHAAVGAVVAFGGEQRDHALAQVDLWSRVQDFFKRYL